MVTAMQLHCVLPIALLATTLAAQSNGYPKVGVAAPVFKAKDQADKEVTVGGPTKTWTVLAFYPKALTGG